MEVTLKKKRAGNEQCLCFEKGIGRGDKKRSNLSPLSRCSARTQSHFAGLVAIGCHITQIVAFETMREIPRMRYPSTFTCVYPKCVSSKTGTLRLFLGRVTKKKGMKLGSPLIKALIGLILEGGGCGSRAVMVSDNVRNVMSSSPVPLKNRRVGEQCTLHLSRAQTSSLWGGVVVRRGGSQLRWRAHHLTMAQNDKVNRQKPSCS
ncbi:uncharacterized protein TNCV_1739801 [Trichonephila clavipes]|nr:uncharacterized protein TNCV_1739801 [Trichonephila clavipes]